MFTPQKQPSRYQEAVFWRGVRIELKTRLKKTFFTKNFYNYFLRKFTSCVLILFYPYTLTPL